MTGEAVVLEQDSDETAVDAEHDDQGVIIPPTQEAQLLQAKKLSAEDINGHVITDGYRAFSKDLATERSFRPAALRDVLAFPVDVSALNTTQDFSEALSGINRHGNIAVAFAGLSTSVEGDTATLVLENGDRSRYQALGEALAHYFGEDIRSSACDDKGLSLQVSGAAKHFVQSIVTAPAVPPCNRPLRFCRLWSPAP